MWRRNRFLSTSLAGIDLVFWLCLRDLSERCEEYPFLSAVYDARFQWAAFLVMGFALAWAFFAWNPKSKRRAWLCPLGVGAAYVLFQKVYNLVIGHWGGVYYVVNPWLQLGGICGGAAIFALLALRGGEAPEPEGTVPLTSISKYRSHLMGIGMMGVIALHSRKLMGHYILPLNFITRMGNMGVDIFLFVSGIGMVYSLSRDPSVWNFYKRRARRIYLEAMPWIAAYCVILLIIGRFGILDVLMTCLGVSNLVRNRGFNWYISFILLFYLITPPLYRLLRRRKTRWAWAALLFFLSLLSMFLLVDVLNRESLLTGYSRFPIFMIGMVAGFWLKEDRRLTQQEYRSLVWLALPLFLVAYLLSELELQPIIASMWLCYCIIAPVTCLVLTRAFDRFGGNGRLMRFLEWSGKNSLLIYIWNILLMRFYTMVSARHLAGASVLLRALYTVATVIANYWIVYLIQKAKASLRRRAA